MVHGPECESDIKMATETEPKGHVLKKDVARIARGKAETL